MHARLKRRVRPHSVSPSNFCSVGLCFSGFFFFSSTTCPDGGAPTRSRANSLTAVTALNRFAFFLRPIFLPPVVSMLP